jgi:hypothetical protein
MFRRADSAATQDMLKPGNGDAIIYHNVPKDTGSVDTTEPNFLLFLESPIV